MSALLFTSVILGLGLLLGGCSSTGTGPYAPQEDAQRDTQRAEELNREAAEILVDDPERAEELLREALTADLFYAPAHNNLGVLFLTQEKLYEAASEFEWARKLLPGHPDPRVNLALTLEGAGKTDDALAAYSAALEVYPGYLPAIQGIASLTLRAGREDERMPAWLEEISMRSEEPAWREWARAKRTAIGLQGKDSEDLPGAPWS